jgi:hypothetical protein
MQKSGDWRYLSRDARLEMAGLVAFTTTSREAMQGKRQAVRKVLRKAPAPITRCLGCLAPVPAGELVCGEACDDLAWRLVPTKNGRLWTPRR